MRGRTPAVSVELEPGEELSAALVRLGEERLGVEVEEVEGDEGHRYLLRAAADRLGPREAHALLKRLKAGPALGVERHDLAVQDRRPSAERVGEPGQLGVAVACVLAAPRRDAERSALAVGQSSHAVPLDLERPALVLGRHGRRRREHRLEVARKRAACHALIGEGLSRQQHQPATSGNAALPLPSASN